MIRLASTLNETICDTVYASEDLQLVERVRQGETYAFEQLVDKYHKSVYNLALRLTQDSEEAYDIAQETFLKVYKNIGQFRGDSELKTWIYRITVNHASNQLRWWKRRFKSRSISLDADLDFSINLSSSAHSPEEKTLASEQRRLILQSLNKIKFDFRVAVVLRDIEGFSYEEIAQTLDVSVGTVKSRIARGREELRERLKGTLCNKV